MVHAIHPVVIDGRAYCSLECSGGCSKKARVYLSEPGQPPKCYACGLTVAEKRGIDAATAAEEAMENDAEFSVRVQKEAASEVSPGASSLSLALSFVLSLRGQSPEPRA